MKREGFDDITFFVGTEVEYTPMHGNTTLFVVGLQPVKDIMKHVAHYPDGIHHVYFGANQSFPRLATTDAKEWKAWTKMISDVLAEGIWATLDLDISCVEGLAETGLCEHYNFIPMISAKLPYINQLGYNAVLKLDDRDFQATNPGVWCWNVHDLKQRSHFTNWAEYTQDERL
jgi:hypothetical protein